MGEGGTHDRGAGRMLEPGFRVVQLHEITKRALWIREQQPAVGVSVGAWTDVYGTAQFHHAPGPGLNVRHRDVRHPHRRRFRRHLFIHGQDAAVPAPLVPYGGVDRDGGPVFKGPAQQRTVKGLGGLQVRCPQFVPAECPRRVDQPGTDMVDRLPERDRRTLRVPTHEQATVVRDVKGLHQDSPAEFLHPGRQGIDVIDRDVAVPGRRQVRHLRRRFAQGRDPMAIPEEGR